MAAKVGRVMERLMRDSVNRALGVVVNELRVIALRQKLEKIDQKIPIERIFSQASRFIAGQFGHDPMVEAPTPTYSRTRLRAALEKAAPAWDVTIEGDQVSFSVAAPKSVLPPR